MDQRPLVEGRITNFGISRRFFEFLRFGYFFPFFKKIWFLCILGPLSNHASRWIKDLLSKGLSLILAYFQTYLSFCVLDDFSVFQKKIGFWGIFCLTKHVGNHASRWIRDLWSKRVSLILAYFQTFLSFYVLEDFFCFSNSLGFRVFLVPQKPRFPMDQRSLVKGYISNFGIFLDVFEFLQILLAKPKFWKKLNFYKLYIFNVKIHFFVC